MILESKQEHYLTEAADIDISQRHFVNTVHLANAAEAARWREVSEDEKKQMLRKGTVFDIEQLSPAYLTDVEQLLEEIPEHINEVSFTPVESLAFQRWYPNWGDEHMPMGKEVDTGIRLQYSGTLYEVIQPHALQADWVPGVGTESLYKVVQEEHEGSIDDPIPYNGNMELESGKYYTQDGKTYLCNRNTEQPVYHTLSELVGLYVEEVEETPSEVESTEEEKQ